MGCGAGNDVLVGFGKLADVLWYLILARPPLEFLSNVLAAGAEPADMKSVFDSFTYFSNGLDEGADDTFDNFPALAALPRGRWRTSFGRMHRRFATESLAATAQSLWRQSKSSHKSPAHSLPIRKAGFPRNDVHRMMPFLQHEASGLQPQTLNGLRR